MMNGNGSNPHPAAFHQDVSTEGRWAAKNLNTILISVVLFVLTTGGAALSKMAWDNAMTLAEMKGNLVTKQELDLKIAALKADIEIKMGKADTDRLALEKDLTALKLALAERGITERKK